MSTFSERAAERDESVLRRKMPGIDDEELTGWLRLEPRMWMLRHGPTLYAAGLSADDAGDLYARLGDQVAQMLSQLIDAGRMADLNIRFIHLWAASGLLKPELPTGRRGRTGPPKFTRWVSEARRYIVICEGDQHLAALAAAAGLSVEETEVMRTRGELNHGALETLAALRNFTDGP